jgi:hypothetical protein
VIKIPVIGTEEVLGGEKLGLGGGEGLGIVVGIKRDESKEVVAEASGGSEGEVVVAGKVNVVMGIGGNIVREGQRSEDDGVWGRVNVEPGKDRGEVLKLS